jgi:hypothetical protein
MFTYANMNMKKTWQDYGAKLCHKIGVEQTKRNEGFYSYLYPFKGLA